MSEIDDEALRWAVRQSSHELDQQEQAQFDVWYEANPRHQGAYLRALAIQHPIDQSTALFMTRSEPRIAGAGNGATAVCARRRRFLMFGSALAAGLGAVAVATSLYSPHVERVSIATSLGEFRRVELADKSLVSINSASKLVVEMSKSSRQVYLHEGEAWFEVAKDKSRPFTVTSGGVRVRAVGTAFAVRHEPTGSEIMVTEGIVEVWRASDTTRKTRISAGARAVAPENTNDILHARDVDEIDRKLAWRAGKLVFHDQPLASAIAEFNRYNRRKIVLADTDVGARTLVGQYRTNQPEDFAKDVELLFRVPVRIDAERILIGRVQDRANRRR